MTIANALASSRDRYVRYYREGLAKLRREHADCVPEVTVQPTGAVNPAPYSLLRIDAVYGGAAKPTAIRFVMDPEPTSTSEVLVRGVAVTIRAISWEAVRISFVSPTFTMEQLRNWLSSWIDESDAKTPDEVGLAGVVHSIAWDSAEGGIWSVTIDFGSAPIVALTEVVDLILSFDAQKVVLDSPSATA